MAQTVTTTGALLREWREEAGLKLDRAAVYASDRMGQDISSEKVRRYETVVRDEVMEPLVVAALVDLYGRSLSELPEEVRERVERARDLLSHMSAWDTAVDADTGRGLRKKQSGWVTAVDELVPA